jgi:exonuclease SbcD
VMTLTQAENQSLYRQVYQDMVGHLTADWFSPATVNLVVAHASLFGAKRGGGEREAQTIDSYCVGPEAFPDSCHYVALGHLHRRQQMAANVPVHYSGSPLQIDFGETRNASVAVVVTVTHDTPASTTDRPVTGSRSLVTVPGTLEELHAVAADIDPGAWLKVLVKEMPRRGLADEVREILPNAIAVQTHPDVVAERAGLRRASRDPAATPGGRLSQYLQESGHGDTDRLRALFDELLDQVSTEAIDAGELT